MNQEDVLKLFMIIDNTYNNFAYDDDKIEIWADILQDIPFEVARRNLWGYIRNPENKFPPHPGILAATTLQLAEGPYIPNAEETRRMLDERDQQYLNNTALLPESVRERMKQLGESRAPATGTNTVSDSSS